MATHTQRLIAEIEQNLARARGEVEELEQCLQRLRGPEMNESAEELSEKECSETVQPPHPETGYIPLTEQERRLHCSTILNAAGRENTGSMIRQINESPNHRRDMYRNAAARAAPSKHSGDTRPMIAVSSAKEALDRDDAERSKA